MSGDEITIKLPHFYEIYYCAYVLMNCFPWYRAESIWEDSHAQQEVRKIMWWILLNLNVL